MPVAWSDIVSAFEFVSGGDGGETVFLCRETGEMHWHSGNGDNFEELPEDIDDREKYVKLPDKRDLDLGRRLVMRFTREELPDRYDKVVEIFSRRGAYRRARQVVRIPKCRGGECVTRMVRGERGRGRGLTGGSGDARPDGCAHDG